MWTNPGVEFLLHSPLTIWNLGGKNLVMEILIKVFNIFYTFLSLFYAIRGAKTLKKKQFLKGRVISIEYPTTYYVYSKNIQLPNQIFRNLVSWIFHVIQYLFWKMWQLMTLRVILVEPELLSRWPDYTHFDILMEPKKMLQINTFYLIFYVQYKFHPE